MRISLITPARPGSRAGNRHTATRWAGFLRAAGHRVAIAQEWAPDQDCVLLLALPARRSHASIRTFAREHPDRPLVLALTGTDVYRDIRISPEAKESLELASRFIVLQAKAVEELSRKFRPRTHVVVQSSATRLRQAPVRRTFRICVIGHLRDEKDPLRALYALARLPQGFPVEVIQLGDSLDQDLADAAEAATRSEPRYRWLGGVAHHRALRWLASSHAMVISSRMEGGANVISEAIRIGVPVLASDIPGNVGLLGSRYPAYYPVGDASALAHLIHRARGDRRFYAALKERISRLHPLVAPAREARALRAALET